MIEYRCFSKIYQKYKNFENILKLKYEDLIIKPEKYLKETCEFCDIRYSDEMLSASGKYSSHGDTFTRGVDAKRLIMWKGKIKKFDKFIVRFFSKKAMDRFGYGDIDSIYKDLEINN